MTKIKLVVPKFRHKGGSGRGGSGRAGKGENSTEGDENEIKRVNGCKLCSERRSECQAVGVRWNSRGLQWWRMEQMNVNVVEWGCDVSKRAKGIGIEGRETYR